MYVRTCVCLCVYQIYIYILNVEPFVLLLPKSHSTTWLNELRGDNERIADDCWCHNVSLIFCLAATIFQPPVSKIQRGTATTRSVDLRRTRRGGTSTGSAKWETFAVQVHLTQSQVTHVLWKQTQPGAFSKHPGTALKHGSASHKWASWLPACKRSTRNLPQGYQHDHSAFPTWLRVSYGRTRSIVLLRPFSPDQRCPCSWKASAALPNAGLLNPSQSARARTPLAKRNSPTERWGRSVFETCYKTLGKTWYKKAEPPWVQPVAHAFPPARPARKSSLTTCFLGLNRIDRLAPTSLYWLTTNFGHKIFSRHSLQHKTLGTKWDDVSNWTSTGSAASGSCFSPSTAYKIKNRSFLLSLDDITSVKAETHGQTHSNKPLLAHQEL